MDITASVQQGLYKRG